MLEIAFLIFLGVVIVGSILDARQPEEETKI